MRQVIAALIMGGCILTTGCAGHRSDTPAAVTREAPVTTTVARPVGEDALAGLLLGSDQVNSIMDATEMKVTRQRTALSDDSATMEPRACLAVDGAGQTLVYTNTGYTAARAQTLRESNPFAHYVDQVVVLFSSAKRASSFVDIEAELWPSCHEYSHTQSGSQWSASPAAKAGGVLSVIATQQNSGNSLWSCGRALTARNNVVIDVNTCSADPKDTAAVIAGQIAAKVPVQ